MTDTRDLWVEEVYTAAPRKGERRWWNPPHAPKAALAECERLGLLKWTDEMEANGSRAKYRLCTWNEAFAA